MCQNNQECCNTKLHVIAYLRTTHFETLTEDRQSIPMVLPIEHLTKLRGKDPLPGIHQYGLWSFFSVLPVAALKNW